LKTSIAEHVNGDFLFIDSDTIITTSLEEIDSFDFDIGAVTDHHMPTLKKLKSYTQSQMIKSLASMTKWKINMNMSYFNSGVICVKYNYRTKQFFKDWNKYWHFGMSKGINMDQPALYLANLLNNNIVCELDGVWNCQISIGLNYLKEGKILHYLGMQNQYYNIMFEFMDADLYLDIKKNGDITDKAMRIVKNPLNYITPKCVETMIRRDIFMRTDSVTLLQSIYNKSNKLFKFIEFVSKRVRYVSYILYLLIKDEKFQK
jgi:hypothetical protein